MLLFVVPGRFASRVQHWSFFCFWLHLSIRHFANRLRFRVTRPYDYNSTSPMPSPSIPGAPSPSPFAQQQHSSPSTSSPTTASSPSTINSFHHFSHSADIGSGGFTKQTYSAWVSLPIPEGTPPENISAFKKKWHMTVSFFLHCRARERSFFKNSFVLDRPISLRQIFRLSPPFKKIIFYEGSACRMACTKPEKDSCARRRPRNLDLPLQQYL
jgi:hypothetical protein